MPISAYFDGEGEKVLRQMQKKYGEEKGLRVFYATAKKQGKEPKEEGSGYAREVRSALHHIMEREAQVSEKDFPRQRGILSLTKKALSDNKASEAVERFEKQGSRPSFCAEYIFSGLNFNEGDLVSTLAKVVNAKQGTQVHIVDDNLGIIHRGTPAYIPGQMPEFSQMLQPTLVAKKKLRGKKKKRK